MCFYAAHETLTILDALTFLGVAENPDVSPSQLAEDLGVNLPRFKHIMYGLERGRSDSDAKALGLIEIHQNPTPGFRNQRMLRLSPKGTKLFAQINGGA